MLGGDDTLSKIWNVRTGWLMETIRGHQSQLASLASCLAHFNVVDMAIDQSNKILATAGTDLYIRIWDLETYTPLQNLEGFTDGPNDTADDTGTPIELIRALQQRQGREPSGEPSLQNAVELARRSLAHVPMHVSREIIVVFGSLTSCDPGDILSTIDQLEKESIRVSIIGLAAEMQICKRMSSATKGTYHVAMNEAHFKELLMEHVQPPPLLAQHSISNIIEMGFPTTKVYDKPVLCSCHHTLIRKAHICPRCLATICEIPTDCCLCSLTLVSSPSLARSYHHLFPVPNFVEVDSTAQQQQQQQQQRSSTANPSHCFACLTPFYPQNAAVGAPSVARFACQRCGIHVCLDCDVYIHEVLHNCPGCTRQ
eukprot:jgi/Hompol1/1653/HPOL_000827-RA